LRVTACHQQQVCDSRMGLMHARAHTQTHIHARTHANTRAHTHIAGGGNRQNDACGATDPIQQAMPPARYGIVRGRLGGTPALRTCRKLDDSPRKKTCARGMLGASVACQRSGCTFKNAATARCSCSTRPALRRDLREDFISDGHCGIMQGNVQFGELGGPCCFAEP
jgi:hypothetical protein